ncbi:L-cystine transport system permease protein [Kineothrix alysoides]|uniref:L-cystine transport system permease protein n=1 Tax=Kineothrix alysoides TaxID=1469948 RepID=A0A4R1R606_9FIRM|nr:amino acid ABC transporter permease [Kineothrix alysoides]TCL60910.1 L-cystine transport system permease protein [Kineothrix alysoides]
MENTYDLSTVPSYIPKILKALPVTAEILIFSLLFGLLLGALVTMGALGKNKMVRIISNGYISFMRGIPTLVLIFLLYLGLPQLMVGIGIDLSAITKTKYIIACLSLGSSANMAEMMRASYLAVDKGQREAAYSVGMKGFTAFRRIILPQAVGIAIPTLGNNIIMLFKETSLAFTVGVIDLLGKARAISSASYGTNRLEVYIATGIVFWIICILMEYISKAVEKVYTKGRKQATS